MNRTLLILITLLSGLLAHGANKCVRAAASGAGNGNNWTDAYTALPATLTRGDTYYVAGGAYAAYTFDDAGTDLITVKKATVADHGGIETGWSDSYGTTAATWGNITFSASNIEFNGAVGGGPTNWNGGHGFTMSNVTDPDFFTLNGLQTNITIKHVAADSDRGATANPTGIGSTGYGHFIKGTAGAADIDISFCAATEIFGVIYHIGSWTNCVSEYNYFYWNRSTPDDLSGTYDPGADYQHAEGVSSIGVNVNCVWRFSLWDKIAGTAVFAGVNFGSSHDWKIYGNIFSRSVTTVYYYWEDPGSNQNSMTNAVVYNNTIVGGIGPSQGSFAIQRGGGNVGRNNLMYLSSGNAQYQGFNDHNYSWAGGNFNSDDPGIDNDAQFIDGEANGVEGSGTTSPFVSYNADPLLADLSATTPAGATLSSPYNVDMYGTTRTLWTRGAIEQGSGPDEGGGAPVEQTKPILNVGNFYIR